MSGSSVNPSVNLGLVCSSSLSITDSEIPLRSVDEVQEMGTFFGNRIKDCFIGSFSAIQGAALERQSRSHTPRELKGFKTDWIESIDVEIKCQKTIMIFEECTTQALGISAEASSLNSPKKNSNMGLFDFKILSTKEGEVIAKFDEVQIQPLYREMKLFSVFHKAYTETLNKYNVEKDFLYVNSEEVNTAAIYRARGYELTDESIKTIQSHGMTVEQFFENSSVFYGTEHQIQMVRKLTRPVLNPLAVAAVANNALPPVLSTQNAGRLSLRKVLKTRTKRNYLIQLQKSLKLLPKLEKKIRMNSEKLKKNSKVVFKDLKAANCFSMLIEEKRIKIDSEFQQKIKKLLSGDIYKSSKEYEDTTHKIHLYLTIFKYLDSQVVNPSSRERRDFDLRKDRRLFGF